MEKICWKGHAAMFGANAMLGLMSPISKFIMLGGAVTPLCRKLIYVSGVAMVLFWIASFFKNRNMSAIRTWQACLLPPF